MCVDFCKIQPQNTKIDIYRDQTLKGTATLMISIINQKELYEP